MLKRPILICSIAVFTFLVVPAYANDRPCNEWIYKSRVSGKLSQQKQLIVVPASDSRPFLLLRFDRDTAQEKGAVIWSHQRDPWVFVSLEKVTVVKLDKPDNTRVVVNLVGGCPDDSGHVTGRVESVVIQVSKEVSLERWKERIARAQKLYDERNSVDVLPQIEERK